MENQNFNLKLFGGKIKIIVYTPKKDSQIKTKEIVQKGYIEALRLQKIFNFFDEESELSLLNSKRKLKVSKDLLSVIKKALEFSYLTNGEYDISLGKKILQRKKGEQLKKINSSYKDIEIKSNEILLKNKDALLDLGSIAKGYITDKLGEFLKKEGLDEFIIDSRGDILVSGKNEYLIGVQHPRESKTLFKLKLKNEAVATSGDYNQFDKIFDKSHIINQKEIISITVIAPKLEEADAYATALFVASEKERNELIKKNKNVKVLIMDKKLNQNMFNNFKEKIYNEY